MSSDTKLALPAFLKVLTNANMTMPKAMIVASKVFKTHNTPTALGDLTDAKLRSLGVESKEDRKATLSAFKKAGYKPSGPGASGAAAKPRAVGGSLAQTSSAGAGPSTLGKKASQTPKKRKRDDDLNEPLPAGPKSEGASLGSLEFNEVLDEEILRTKSAMVNRAPVMSLWTTIVSERLGFKREEALSIASAYTEMNAISKGVSLGIFEQSKGKGIELEKGQSQPYVDLMGRRVYVVLYYAKWSIPYIAVNLIHRALYQTQNGEWRALVKGEPVEPASAFSYISRAFRQTLPYVAGAMRILAASFPPVELNEKGFGIYAEFRPDVDGWGKRAEIRCSTILSLRKPPDERTADNTKKAQDNSRGEQPFVGYEKGKNVNDGTNAASSDEPLAKKAKNMTVEEYEAALDASFDYDELIYTGEF